MEGVCGRDYSRMNIYIVEFFLLCFNALLYGTLERKGKRNVYILSCLEILLIAICRSPADPNWPDTQTYLNWFDHFASFTSWKQFVNFSWEPGIIFTSKVIGMFSNTPQTYIVVLGIIILVPVFTMIWKYSKYPCISLIVFISMNFLTLTSIYRQWCAIAILMYSFKYVYKRDFKRFILLVTLAFLFHRTAILFLLVYFMYNIKVTLKKLIIGFCVSIGLIFMGESLLPILNRFARIKWDTSFNGGISLYAVLWIVVVFSYILCRKYMQEDSYRLSFNMVLFAAILQSLSFTFSIWSRAILYFYMILIILLPNTLYNINNQDYRSRRGSIAVNSLFVCLMFLWLLTDCQKEYIAVWQ